MPVIHIGDGKHIEMAEGSLKPPPAVEPKKPRADKGSKQPAVSPKRPPKKTKVAGENHWFTKRLKTIPGYKEWLALRTNQMLVGIRRPRGKKPGTPHGMRWHEAQPLWEIAKQKAKVHMANIKKVIPLEDERAEKALLATLEVLESPMNQTTKLAAARQVLEWTRAKPASKQEVTVNAAEAWLASIAEEANGKADD
jgi:pyruvate/2-oxoacid:ferredoxin oxidoreductase alpha subunit